MALPPLWRGAITAKPCLTSTRKEIRIAAKLRWCSMTTQMCVHCNFPGDGNCSLCHGTGSVPGAKIAGAFVISGEVSPWFCRAVRFDREVTR